MTKIEWTRVPDGKGGFKKGETLNHQVGCQEVSPACRHCYAAGQAHLHAKGIKQHAGLTVVRDNGVHWNGEINRVPAMLVKPLQWREPRGVFVGSMTDTFFDVSTDDACRWIASLFGVMAMTERHTYMLLTKRPENAARWYGWVADAADEHWTRMRDNPRAALGTKILRFIWSCLSDAIGGAEFAKICSVKKLGDWYTYMPASWSLPNVWVGCTTEDRKRFDERVPILRRIPAAVHFLSCEPLVEDLGDVDLSGIQWVIAGGESGPRARPSHPDWVRSLRDRCIASGTPYFFKQWGEHAPLHDKHWQRELAAKSDRFDASDWNYTRGVWVGEPREGSRMVNVGKAAAGRELDGRTWDEFPEVSQ